ncbi:MAG: DUF3127 domain-containing protein [Bacteroidales bacterium]|nr:DUF3127 domain-containing protein [Bacteroidales bacterium]
MAALEIEGKILQKLSVASGTSARGAWAKQDFILEYQDGNFPAQICLTAWGQDKVDELAKYKEGDTVKASFNIRAREYNGRWYNDIRVWRLSAAGAQAPSPAARPAAPAPAPAPSIDDAPAGFNASADDMPF